MPRVAITDDVEAFYDGGLDNGYWAVAKLESTHGGAWPGRAQKINEYFRRIQQICWETGTEIP